MSTRVEVRQGAMDISVSLAAMDCPGCFIVFAVPDRLEKERRADAKTFYCPNGHSMSFSDSEATKLRRKLASAEQDAQWYKTAEAEARQRADAAERSRAAIKGQVTKLKKRIVAGACPFGCHRHFANLERHVATKHAGQQLGAETADGGA